MEFRQIQYFICLFEEGTVTRAARRLNIVQPALSMQIAKLEEDIGQQLFQRTKQGMIPTAAARNMYRLFLPIMRDFSNARTQLLSSDGEISGQVNIGMIASVTEGVLADTLSAFSARHPNVGVRVVDGYTATLSDWVAGGQIDAALINKPRRQLALNVEHIADEEMVLVTGTAYPANLPPRLTLRQITASDVNLVLPTREHGLRGILDSFAQHEDVDLAPIFEVDSLVTSVKLVEQTPQLGTILPHIAVYRGLVEGRLRAHAIVSPRLIRQVVAVSHPRRPLNSATTAFITLLKEQMQARTQGQGTGETVNATPPL
ncbi:MAG TPA: LysR family transcriptional regulator [Noviherbaspirillum sp.]|nr:LysR family transcriptional regulator [Noviherbaspirillum sp.]